MQEACYFYAVVEAEAHKGIDAQLGVEAFALSGFYLPLGQEKGVEISHEVGIDLQENSVEDGIEFL